MSFIYHESISSRAYVNSLSILKHQYVVTKCNPRNSFEIFVIVILIMAYNLCELNDNALNILR